MAKKEKVRRSDIIIAAFQQSFTFSKSTIETLEKVGKHVQS